MSRVQRATGPWLLEPGTFRSQVEHANHWAIAPGRREERKDGTRMAQNLRKNDLPATADYGPVFYLYTRTLSDDADDDDGI